MYYLINNNIGLIIEHINRADIERYRWLINTVQIADATQTREFQMRYRDYWDMGTGRFADEFYAHYFNTMQNCRNANILDINEILRLLYEVPTNARGQSLQFSFSSKLVHVISPTTPVFDRMIKQFYFLKDPNSADVEVRINTRIAQYNFLVNEYARIIALQLLEAAINTFREHYNLDDVYTDSRIIDLLIWQFVKLAENGAIIDGDITYS